MKDIKNSYSVLNDKLNVLKTDVARILSNDLTEDNLCDLIISINGLVIAYDALIIKVEQHISECEKTIMFYNSEIFKMVREVISMEGALFEKLKTTNTLISEYDKDILNVQNDLSNFKDISISIKCDKDKADGMNSLLNEILKIKFI